MLRISFATASTILLLTCLVPTTSQAAGPDASQVEYVSPRPGSARVSPYNNIVVRYAGSSHGKLVEGSMSIEVVGSKSGSHRGRLILLDDSHTVIFVADRAFALGEQVTVTATPRQRPPSDGASMRALTFRFETSSTDPQRQTAPANPATECALEMPSGPRSYSVRSQPTLSSATLPADLPNLTLLRSNNPDPGNVFVAPFSFPSPYGNLTIVDNLGTPVFYRRIPQWCYDFKVQPNGWLTYARLGPNFYALDSNYALVDSFHAGNGYPLTDLHDLLLLDNGHALLMVKDPQVVHMDSVVVGGHPNASVRGLLIQELDANKNVVFQWRSWDHFDITDGAVSNYVTLTDSVIDYVHGNAVEVDYDGHILLSSRHMNEITKINRQTGDIIWRFGPNAVHNDFSMVNDTRGFSHQHDVRRLPNGHISLFDNGNFLSPAYSRVLEYELDEINMVATLVWEYRHTPDIDSPAMGGAQRRASGGTMIGWGMTATAPQVTDIHADGSTAYELGFDAGTFTYRAFRFPWQTTRFTASTDTLDFGNVEAGETSLRSVFVRNDWNSDVTITSLVSSDVAFVASTPVPFTMAPGDSAEVSLVFDPVLTGEAIERLYIRAETDIELVAQTVILKGSFGTATSGVVPAGQPLQDRLHASSPNPFNPTTSIRYEVAQRSHVAIEVFDARGRLVATLVDGVQPPGEHEVFWHAPQAASGVYVVRMKTAAFVASRKLTVLR